MNDLCKEFIEIKNAADHLEGLLEIPQDAIGVAAFVHVGDHFGQHNNYVAQQLHRARIGTLMLDLLTRQEKKLNANRFNFDLLTQRLTTACRWLGKNTITSTLPLGLFGTHTGAGAVLQLAITYNKRIAAIVLHEGRMTTWNHRTLLQVTTPTLFIVDGCDHEALVINRRVYFLLNCKKKLEIIRGRLQLNEERDALEKLAGSVSAFFLKYMDPPVFLSSF